mmetsp:Transcript_6070/g.9866  ORF Transcript_6070/g.9866 Transcript_6070/m.9866 type:complete len:123 (-) Transcript_6070:780-1148(-)
MPMNVNDMTTEEEECWGLFVDIEICAGHMNSRKTVALAKSEDKVLASGVAQTSLLIIKNTAHHHRENLLHYFVEDTWNPSSCQSFLRIESDEALLSKQRSFQSEEMMFPLDIDFECSQTEFH